MKHLKSRQELNEASENLNISDVISSKNMWLEKLQKDLLQNKYNLKKTTKGNVLYTLLCGVNYYERTKL